MELCGGEVGEVVARFVISGTDKLPVAVE